LSSGFANHDTPAAGKVMVKLAPRLRPALSAVMAPECKRARFFEMASMLPDG
jgi:hypothetical protein